MPYCVVLTIIDQELNQKVRPAHLRYLETLYRQGRVLMAGPFQDGLGGMVIYQNVTQEEAERLAREDPAVASGAREMALRPWTILDFASEDA